ncbi:MAG: peptide-methionine (R)-S-oxide reductase MsrB [Gammaproteobacteria bacterium]|nr:peptide-methionine (R)-S-oxide reductase MsrB [Gammaproteobacteria bacterium]
MSKIRKTDEEWRAELSPLEYAVCREHGTERPFTGEFNHCGKAGDFVCKCCGALLFDSSHKYDSGSGWPSFWQPAEPRNIETRSDRSHGMVRVEVLCAQCEAHLGHVFPDGPEPTGMRYCINSVSLALRERGE